MESKLQYAHGWLGRYLHGRAYGGRSYYHLLSEHKIISDGVMGSKMIRLIMISEVVFFLLAGMQIVSHERQCARIDAVSEIFITMPLSSLSDVSI